MQLRIPVKTIDASVIAREAYSVLPFDLLRAHRVVPRQWSPSGRLIVACAVLPEAEITTEWVMPALAMAVGRHQAASGWLHHRDRGSPDASVMPTAISSAVMG